MHPVIQVAAKLAIEGKEPTMALVKTRLPQPLPMAEIINALKQYKASPLQYQQEVKQLAPVTTTDEEPESDQAEPTANDEITLLKTELQQLKAEVAELKLMIKNSNNGLD